MIRQINWDKVWRVMVSFAINNNSDFFFLNIVFSFGFWFQMQVEMLPQKYEAVFTASQVQ
jgi:hypothetical protein